VLFYHIFPIKTTQIDHLAVSTVRYPSDSRRVATRRRVSKIKC